MISVLTLRSVAGVVLAAAMVLVLIAACELLPDQTPAATDAAAGPPPAIDYEPFPAGYDYRVDPGALEQAVKAGNLAAVRRHAWFLWAGIMQPATSLPGWPVWSTWPNSFGAFQTRSTALLGASSSQVSRTMLAANASNAPIITPAPTYPVPAEVIRAYPAGICKTKSGTVTVCDGPTFVNNGDILIPTESLSQANYNWIRSNKLYQQARLDDLHAQGRHQLTGPDTQVVTKHMFWPVPAKGLSAIPVWHDDFGPNFTGYAGYEKWGTLIAVDPSGTQVGTTQTVTYLHGVYNHNGTKELPAVTHDAVVYGLDSFYHVKVSAADWARFTAADKAILNAASRWAYDKPFGIGDYLVTVAMHINTREIPSWALQSVWWSDRAGEGPFAADRPAMPRGTVGPWSHYLMTTGYAMPQASGALPVSMNPYIELAIHPVATNCNNCHRRAGWPTGSGASHASYQNAACPNALEFLTATSPCLTGITLTDFQWIIPDRAK